MNSKSLIKIIIITLCFFIFTNVAIAAPVKEDTAINWINNIGRKLINTISTSNNHDKFKSLDTMFSKDVDMDYMARFVIGKYWKNMDSEQQKQYIELFKRYTLSVYKNYPLDFDTTGLDFEVLSVKQNQKFTDVSCSIILPEQFATENVQSINVKFKLSQTDNQIKIIDLIFGQSSLLMTYRTRFYTMIADLDEEMSWFLEDFSDMVISSEKTAEEKAHYY